MSGKQLPHQQARAVGQHYHQRRRRRGQDRSRSRIFRLRRRRFQPTQARRLGRADVVAPRVPWFWNPAGKRGITGPHGSGNRLDLRSSGHSAQAHPAKPRVVRADSRSAAPWHRVSESSFLSHPEAPCWRARFSSFIDEPFTLLPAPSPHSTAPAKPRTPERLRSRRPPHQHRPATFMGIEFLMVASGLAMDKVARSEDPSFRLQGAGKDEQLLRGLVPVRRVARSRGKFHHEHFVSSAVLGTWRPELWCGIRGLRFLPAFLIRFLIAIHFSFLVEVNRIPPGFDHRIGTTLVEYIKILYCHFSSQ